MRIFRISLCLLSILLLLPGLVFSQKDIQKQIQAIETLLDDQVAPWKVKKGNLDGGEKKGLDDAGWEVAKPVITLRDKVSWLRHDFRVPEVFAGVKTEGSKILLSVHFQGVGVVRGQYFLDGELLEQFSLDFGNQEGREKKEFLLTPPAKPGERVLIAFRLEHLGRVPLLERDILEQGAYLQLRETRFSAESGLDARNLLVQFLLDAKMGMVLLDAEPKKTLPARLIRPVSKEYEQFVSSKEFCALGEAFEKALLRFNLDALRTGDSKGVKDSLSQFYTAAEPISLLANKYTLTVAGNSHIDLAWLWRWQETVEVGKETFRTIMDNMEEYPEIIYIQSQAQLYKWMEEYYPDVFDRIKKKVKEGRWEIIGGMWAEPDCNLIDGESFIRQILYGKKYFWEKFGVNVKIGWNPDSFGYNWNMPQFFRKSGFDSFITQKISWNDTNVFPYFLFWWEAPDGSRILTYFPPTGYVGSLRAEEMINGLKAFERNTGMKNALILYGLGNHGGGPNREMLNRVREYKKQKIFPQVKHSSVSDYFGQLKKRNLKALPVWKDELYLEYHRGTFTTQAKTKELNRRSEVLLSDAEKISSLSLLLGSPYDGKALKEAWEKVLLNQFHDILPGSSIAPVYRDAAELYEEAQELATKSLMKSLGHIAQKIDTSGGADGIPLLVFNTLSWERNGIVKTALPSQLKGGVQVFDEKNREVPSQILTSPDKEKILCFVAKSVPPLGYTVYKLKRGIPSEYPSSLKAKDTTLENQYFQVTLHPQTGNIISLFDKIHKKEIIAASADGNEIQLFEDIPDRWDAWEIKYTGRKWKLNAAENIVLTEKGPVRACLEVKKSFLGLSKDRWAPTPDFPSSFFTQKIILTDDIPRIDIEMAADWWETHVLCKVAFPVDIKADKATFEIPFAAIQRPTTRNTDWERARHEVPAIRWADLSDNGYGVSLLNNSKYGYDIEGNVMRLTLLRAPLWPDPTADRGKHSFSYALYPHKGDWREADTVLRGYEFNTPLLVLYPDAHPGELPPRFSFVKISPENILLAAIKKAEEGDGLILRLYESEGRPAESRVELFQKPKKAFELDLMENRLHSLFFKEKAVALKFGKSEIKTLELIF